MSRFGIVTFVIVCVAVLIPPASHATLDFTSPSEAASDLEIVVVEAPGCIYCHLFRRDVWPFYENSQLAKSVPMRFVDLNSQAVQEFALQSPIESVPTALVLRQNKELGRVPGYVGLENFSHLIDRVLASTP